MNRSGLPSWFVVLWNMILLIKCFTKDSPGIDPIILTTLPEIIIKRLLYDTGCLLYCFNNVRNRSYYKYWLLSSVQSSPSNSSILFPWSILSLNANFHIPKKSANFNFTRPGCNSCNFWNNEKKHYYCMYLRK